MNEVNLVDAQTIACACIDVGEYKDLRDINLIINTVYSLFERQNGRPDALDVMSYFMATYATAAKMLKGELNL